MVPAGVMLPLCRLQSLELGGPVRNEQVHPDCAASKLDDLGCIVEPLNPSFLICTMGCS